MSIDAMKQALEALEKSVSTCFDRYAHEEVMSRPEHFINQTITALCLAIEQAERQEPVAWRYRGNLHEFDPSDWAEGTVTPLYTAPPQRELAGLTDEEFSDCLVDGDPCEALAEPEAWAVMREVEAKLREKNTAPPQRQPLTEEEIVGCIDDDLDSVLDNANAEDRYVIRFARAIERKHGIGGGE